MFISYIYLDTFKNVKEYFNNPHLLVIFIYVKKLGYCVEEDTTYFQSRDKNQIWLKRFWNDFPKWYLENGDYVFIFLSLTLHVVYQQKEYLTIKICLQKFVLKELASCNFFPLFSSLDIYMGLVFYIYYTTKLH